MGLGPRLEGLRARALHYKISMLRKKNVESINMKYFYLAVNIPKELIKLLSRHLDALRFEIKAILGPLGHIHVPKQNPKFWWFSEHKI